MPLGFAVKTRRLDLDVMLEGKGKDLALLRVQLARRGVGLADRGAG